MTPPIKLQLEEERKWPYEEPKFALVASISTGSEGCGEHGSRPFG